MAATIPVVTRATLDDRLTDQVRLSLSAPEWVTASYEYHFHHGGYFYRDPFLQFEAGVGGGKFSVGSGYLESPPPGDYCVGEGLKLSLLRTWGDPIYGESDTTYLGVEVERFFKMLGHSVVKLGIFHPLDGHEGDQEILVTVGIGIPIFSSPRGPSYFGH
jgi:hypothetical protein